MDADEQLIIDYLKSWPGQFVATREIARRADGKRRFREDPHWAPPVLSRLVEQNLIESDSLGHYRYLAKAGEEARKKANRWISPHLREILERSGKDFTHILDEPAEEFV